MRISAITYNPNFVGVKNSKYIPLEDLLAFTVKENNITVPKSPDKIMKYMPTRIKLKRQSILKKNIKQINK